MLNDSRVSGRTASAERPLRARKAPLARGLSWLVLVAAAFGLTGPACSSDTAKGPAQAACALPSDCTSPFVCALGQCRSECHTPADCGKDQNCVGDGKYAVCVDRNAACNAQADCTKPLACATDYRCRNLCHSDADCNVLGIHGRVCAKDENDVEFCAEVSETSGEEGSRTLTAEPPAVHDDAPVPAPVVEPGSGSGGEGGAPGAPIMTDGGTPGGGTSNAQSGSGGTGGTGLGQAGIGEGGGAGEGPVPACVPACPDGKVCKAGSCQFCGGSSQPCCDDHACDANLTCNADGACKCGGANEACCDGTGCSGGLMCSGGATPICACGLAGSSCCPAQGGGKPTCASADLQCAGASCSCVAELAASASMVLVRRLDNSLSMSYNGGAYQEVMGPSGALHATAIATSSNDDFGCAVVGGAVWCFPGAGTTSDSTYLGAGLGAVPTSGAVQVVTSGGVTPPQLINVVQISGGQRDGGSNFCAVTSAGAIWCWGYNYLGMLGTGDSTIAPYARKVLASSGVPFDNAVEVRLGYGSACARKGDGSVWCWGDNSNGQLGTLLATLSQAPFPVQVSLPKAATRLSTSPMTTPCAILEDTSVTCWGYNGGYYAGGQFGLAGAPTDLFVVPTTVLVAAGGAPLLGVLDVGGDSQSQAVMANCAKTGTQGLVCWGRANLPADAPYPSVVREPGSAAAIANVSTPLTGAAWNGSAPLVYVSSSGLVTKGAGQAPMAVQPSCP